LRQDSINAAISPPTISGNQPPSMILMEFETRNVASIAPKIPILSRV